MTKPIILIAGIILIIAIMLYSDSQTKDYAKLYKELSNAPNLKKATFAGGCFWCLEGPFEQLEGVREVFAGYSGGTVENPSYERVIMGNTGHRETVQVIYDPSTVSYERLVEVFWWQIDPTDPGGQFTDRGEQYTTAIFYHDESQKAAAETSKNELGNSDLYQEPIATKLLPFKNFYLAEDYHQDFYIHSEGRYKRYETGSGRKSHKELIKEKLNLD